MYANLYHNFGFNITHIAGNQSKDMSFKEPTDPNWKEYIKKPQDVRYIQSQNWADATGIGLLLGYGQYRAIDIDYLFCGQGDLLFIDERELKVSDFISTCLELLGLPFDYSWVIKSGSGLGYHIIIKAEDINDFDISSLAYNPSSKFQSDFNLNFELKTEENECIMIMTPFLRMELRWEDHLVLPTSTHKTGKKYEFYFGSIPNYSPMEVSVNNLNILLNYYCSEEEYKKYVYEGKEIYLTRLKKTCAEYSSWTWKLKYKTIEDNINWLLKCHSSEALNSLGVAYTLGKGVLGNSNKAKSYFEQSNNSLAHFNMANLIACGYIDGSRADVNYHLSFCDNVPNEYKEIIKANAMQTLPPLPPPPPLNKKYYLFFDTETTGIPAKYDAPMSDLKNWPRLVQIAWIACDENGNILESEEHIIKPNGFAIPKDSTSLHGISTEKAIREGKNIKDVLTTFTKLVKESKYIVGHNISFDMNIVGAELIRSNMECIVQNKSSICTMKSTVNFCAFPGKYSGYKLPKLEELYYKLFGKSFSNAHTAMNDIKATKECFFELKKRNII